MADEKKKGGWFSRFKGNKPKESPSVGTGSKQQATASPKPAPKAKPTPPAKPASTAKPAAPKAKPATTAKPAAPAAKATPAPRQAPSEKKASNRENPLRMEPIDTGLKNIYR